VSDYLILHGLGGSGPEHWQSWLAEQLHRSGERVAYPDLPAPDDPEPEPWLAALEAELERAATEPIVICHSLACLLWLRAAAGAERRLAERVLLVAPPWREDLAPVARFLVHGADASAVAAAAGETLIVCSDADPYCPPGALATFARPLRIPAAVVAGGGHLNPETGYGPWPQAEAWAREGAGAFAATLASPADVEGAPSPGPLP
jgi:hypothetical protein